MTTSNLSMLRHPLLALSGWLRLSPFKGEMGDLLKVGIALLITLSALAMPFYDVLTAMIGLVDAPHFEGPGPAAPAAMTAGVTDALSAEGTGPDEAVEQDTLL